MAEPDQPSRGASAADRRRERLAAELRANLAKRKKQARARKSEHCAGSDDSAAAARKSANPD